MRFFMDTRVRRYDGKRNAVSFDLFITLATQESICVIFYGYPRSRAMTVNVFL